MVLITVYEFTVISRLKNLKDTDLIFSVFVLFMYVDRCQVRIQYVIYVPAVAIV